MYKYIYKYIYIYIYIHTYIYRELLEGETKLKDKEYRLLDKINDAYFLPEWAPASTYVRVAKDLGLQDVRQVNLYVHVYTYRLCIYVYT
jgi:hypothetical protein